MGDKKEKTNDSIREKTNSSIDNLKAKQSIEYDTKDYMVFVA